MPTPDRFAGYTQSEQHLVNIATTLLHIFGPTLVGGAKILTWWLERGSKRGNQT